MAFIPVIFNEKDSKMAKNLKNRERRKKMGNIQINIDKDTIDKKNNLYVPMIKRAVEVKKLKLNKNKEYEMRFLKLFKNIYEFFSRNFREAEKELKKIENHKKQNQHDFSESSSILKIELE